MKFDLLVAVDVSKEWFNYATVDPLVNLLAEGQEDNNEETIMKFIEQFIIDHQLEDLSNVLLLMEHTGIYCQHLANLWIATGGLVSIVPANHISEGLTGSAGWDHKTDALDARRIAEYGVRFHDKLTLATLKKDSIAKLAMYRTLRARLLKDRKILIVPANESALFDPKEISQLMMNVQAPIIDALNDAIKNVDQEILNIINNDPQLKRYYKQLISVSGVGPVTAVEVIVETEGFRTFTPMDAAKFKRYSKCAPVPKQSGKKRRKPRTSRRGSSRLNSLLTMGAMSVSRSKNELGQYYRRKIEEGKDHLVVINALRSKIIDRMFAVVKNDTMYVKNLNLV